LEHGKSLHLISQKKFFINFDISTHPREILHFKDLQQKYPSHETAPLEQRIKSNITLPELLQEQASSLGPLVASVVLLSCLYLSILKKQDI
jgi:hypothetical protein